MVFSGITHHYQDRCDYIYLNIPGVFQVHVRQGECNPAWSNPSVACIQAVAFSVPNATDVIQFGTDSTTGSTVAYHNGQPLSISSGQLATVAGVVITNDGWRFTAQFPDGSRVAFGPMTCDISLPSQYRGRTSGICGPWDDIEGNDFTNRNGQVVPDLVTFGRSWRVNPNDPQLLMGTSTETCNMMNIGDKKRQQSPIEFDCSDPADLSTVFDLCSFSSLQNCTFFTDLSQFQYSCVYDVCQIGRSFADAALAAAQSRCTVMVEAIGEYILPTTGSATSESATSESATSTGSATSESATSTGSATSESATSATSATSTSETEQSSGAAVLSLGLLSLFSFFALF